MRKAPPPHPRGEPGHPARAGGGGVRTGAVQMRELMSSLCDDVDCRSRLRQTPGDVGSPDDRGARLAHVVGKPTERVQLSADATMNQKLEQERGLLCRWVSSRSRHSRRSRRALVDQGFRDRASERRDA